MNQKWGADKESCVLCNGNHNLDECKTYNDMVVKECSKFITKQKLCCGCYEEISSTHTARNCPKQRECKIYLGKHPTGLRGFKSSSKKANGNKSSTDDDKTVRSNCAYVGDSYSNHTCDPTVLSMCVVPVRIQHEKSNKEVISFAMLDACSQGTFSTNTLMKDLGIEGTRTSINIKVLNGQERQSTYVLDGIKVCRLTPEADKYQKWIKLPSTYTKVEIPVGRNEIAVPAKLKQWQVSNIKFSWSK